MAMSDNVNLVWKMFKDLGYSDIATSALVGNAMTESFPDLKPTAVNEDDADSQGSSSFGIFQWRDSKKEGAGGWDSPRIQWLKTFAKEKNLDPNDIRTQVLFTDWELRNKFRSTWDKLQTSKNVNDATMLVDSSYLFSRKTEKNKESRLTNANQVLKNFSGIEGDMDYRSGEEKFNQKKIKEYENFIDKNQIYKNMSNSGDDMENKDNSTFIGKFKNYVSNPDNFGDMMGRIGTLANRLTLDPDPQYSSRMNEGRLLQQQMEKQNRTADILEGMGQTELAEMMRLGQIDGGEALRYIKGDTKIATNVREYLQAKEAGLIPDDMEYGSFLRNKSGTNIVDDNYRDKELFNIDVERYKEYSLANANIADEKQQLDLMQSLLDDGLFTGGGANLKLGTYRIAEQLGLTNDATNQIIANTENFQAFSNRIILGIMGGSLGVGFSDGDRKFTTEQAPYIGNSIKGNRDLIKYMKEAIKRKLVMKTEMENYLRGGERRSWNGSMKNYEGGLNAFDVWAYSFAEDNPIFPEVDSLEG